MPKGSRRAAKKGAPYSKGRKSEKKRYAARQVTAVDAKQTAIPERTPVAPLAQVSTAMQQMADQRPYVVKELKRVGIITVAMLLLLIILYLVL